MKTRFIIFLIWIVLSTTTKARSADSIQVPQLVFELPIFDLPYQIDAAKTVNGGDASLGGFFKGYANPSMHQSLNLSTDLYTGLHFGIDRLFKLENRLDIKEWKFGKRFLYYMSFYSLDFVSVYAPGFDGWEHEEYHRAVMSRFHVNSFNDMNRFPLGSELISVNNISDEDLIRFKKESPTDFIRMHAAGIEGEYLLVDQLQRNNFYYNQHLFHEYIYLFTTLNSIMYVQICSDPNQVDVLTDDMNSVEESIPKRDFTGLDFTAWTYDLFRPDEPYTDRGIHPLGNGIDRYIKTSDLTSYQRAYLKKQGALQWLNVISPMMLGFRSIKLSRNGLYGNFSIRNYLTSFGNDISCNIFLKSPEYKVFFGYHSYQNYHNLFPAIEAQLLDYKKKIGDCLLNVSPRILIGLQPLNQGFKTEKAAFLGLAECKVEWQTKGIMHPYVEISAKSKGWIAGNEFLDENLSFRFGIISRINK
ncbi:MAG: hypothetical protein ACERKD_11935 [Prolixibacteraceae bacterium]